MLKQPKGYYAVVDIEALVFGPGFKSIAEQLAIVFYDARGAECWAEHYNIFQPYTIYGLREVYGIPEQRVASAVESYERITGDSFLHHYPNGARWSDVKKHILAECNLFAIKIYAKGPELENELLGGRPEVQDLASFGCPKYPQKVHNPLDECRFFSRWIPELFPKK